MEGERVMDCEKIKKNDQDSRKLLGHIPGLEIRCRGEENHR